MPRLVIAVRTRWRSCLAGALDHAHAGEDHEGADAVPVVISPPDARTISSDEVLTAGRCDTRTGDVHAIAGDAHGTRGHAGVMAGGARAVAEDVDTNAGAVNATPALAFVRAEDEHTSVDHEHMNPAHEHMSSVHALVVGRGEREPAPPVHVSPLRAVVPRLDADTMTRTAARRTSPPPVER